MERLAEQEHEGLGGGVRGVAGKRLESGRRGHVDDRAAAPLAHARVVAGGEIYHRLDVDADLLELALARSVREPRVDAEAGVVDQDLDGQTQALDALGELVAVGGVGEVRGHHVGSDPVSLGELAGQRFQALAPAGHQRDPVSTLGQAARKCGADA